MSGDPDVPMAERGVVAHFTEDEYLYGIGILRLRITRVTLSRADPEWALVDGIHLDHRGDPHERLAVMIAVPALRRYGLAGD